MRQMQLVMSGVAVMVFLALAGIVQAKAPDTRHPSHVTTALSQGSPFAATTTVAPTRLPEAGGAPVQVTAAGTATAPQTAPLQPLHSITMLLDRQLEVDGSALPTCAPNDLRGLAFAQARQKCQAALVGSGIVTQRIQYPEVAPITAKDSVLFFNADASRVLTYIFIAPPQGPAAYIASGTARGRVLEIPLPHGRGGGTVGFQFRFGKTWSKDGQRHGYVSARCATGTLTNKLTLASSAGTFTIPSTERCTSRG